MIVLLVLRTFEFVKCVDCVMKMEHTVGLSGRVKTLIYLLSPPHRLCFCQLSWHAGHAGQAASWAVDLFPMSSMASSSPVSAVTVRLYPGS